MFVASGLPGPFCLRLVALVYLSTPIIRTSTRIPRPCSRIDLILPLFEDNDPIPEIPIPEPPPHRLKGLQERDDIPALREGESPERGGLDEREGDVPVVHRSMSRRSEGETEGEGEAQGVEGERKSKSATLSSSNNQNVQEKSASPSPFHLHTDIHRFTPPSDPQPILSGLF